MNKATCWIEIKLRKTLWNYQVESKVRKGGGNTWIALWCVATFSGLDFLISLIFLTPLQVNVVLLGLYLQKQLCCVTWDDVQSFNWCSTGRWSSSEICAWSKHTNPGLSTPHFHMITSPERSSNFLGDCITLSYKEGRRVIGNCSSPYPLPWTTLHHYNCRISAFSWNDTQATGFLFPFSQEERVLEELCVFC